MGDDETPKPMDGVEPAAAAVSTPAAGPVATTGDKKKPRFEIKKYNAVALWAWGSYLAAHVRRGARLDSMRLRNWCVLTGYSPPAFPRPCAARAA
jgi:hypothetical protein